MYGGCRHWFRMVEAMGIHSRQRGTQAGRQADRQGKGDRNIGTYLPSQEGKYKQDRQMDKGCLT